MPITKLIVGGFKSLRDRVEIPLAPITLMFGPNSAGKSSVKDAWQELRRKLELSCGPNDAKSRALISRLVRMPDGSAYKAPGMLGVDEEEERFVRHRVILGCEVSNLDSEAVKSNEANSALGKNAGIQAYRDLQGATVEIEIVDDPQDVTAAFDISVDDCISIRYYSFEVAVALGVFKIDDLTRPVSSYSRLFLADSASSNVSTVGVLLLDLSSRPFSSSAMGELTRRFINVVNASSDDWLNSAVKLNGDVLAVRIDAPGRRLVDWFEEFTYAGDPLIAFSVPFTDAAKELSILVNGLNELIYQIESSVVDELAFAHVSGGRRLLSKEDLKGSLRSSPINVVRQTLSYPVWLGIRESNYCPDKKLFGMSKYNPDRDFVNEALSGTLFGLKKYRLESEFTEVIRNRLRDRNERQIGNQEIELEAQLYLVDEHGRYIDIESVGSGVSYVYPVLTALWRAQRSWIEQPELHLHPSAQCEMGDIIGKAFNLGSFSAIETHSEHLLLRILRRIRETSSGKVTHRELACQPEAVAILYFSPQDDGSTQVHQLRVTRGGDFMDRWPDGFFEERSRELFDE